MITAITPFHSWGWVHSTPRPMLRTTPTIQMSRSKELGVLIETHSSSLKVTRGKFFWFDCFSTIQKLNFQLYFCFSFGEGCHRWVWKILLSTRSDNITALLARLLLINLGQTDIGLKSSWLLRLTYAASTCSAAVSHQFWRAFLRFLNPEFVDVSFSYLPPYSLTAGFLNPLYCETLKKVIHQIQDRRWNLLSNSSSVPYDDSAHLRWFSGNFMAPLIDFVRNWCRNLDQLWLVRLKTFAVWIEVRWKEAEITQELMHSTALPESTSKIYDFG